MYQRLESGDVQITLRSEDYDLLLFALGTAVGGMLRSNGTELAYVFMRLANRMNQGNPSFIPYGVAETSDV